MALSTDAPVLDIFVSYARSDSHWLKRLKVHLAPLKDYKFDLWDDTRLKAGDRWKKEIEKALDKANAAILIISADFLASEFIKTDELPPLLEAAQNKGLLILPIIAAPSLFLRNVELSQFQAINDPSRPLISATAGEQEAVFVEVAERLLNAADALRDKKTISRATVSKETFLEPSIWTRLVKIGDWIFDEQEKRIIGAGIRAFLLSREEYGDTDFVIHASIAFTNFKLGMNAGIVFGWKSEGGDNRYYNILLTGSELLIERVTKGGSKADHLTEPVPLLVEAGQLITFEVRVDREKIEIYVGEQRLQSMERPPAGVTGRVGLRPWRSKLDCTEFTVSADPTSSPRN